MRQPSSVRIDRDVAVEMRDGVVLYADVYRPAGDGRWPVLLQRTPYNKGLGSLAFLQTDTLRAVGRGYAVVIQDCRGRYASDGQFTPFHQEIEDGYDTVEWCGSQAWSDGQVGMYGTSYVGAVQWLAAIAAPPSLRCIVPTFTGSDYYEGWTYQGGALQWGFMCNWVLPFVASADLVRAHERGEISEDAFVAARSGLIASVDSMAATVQTTPLRDLPIDATVSPYFATWLDHPSRDEFWRSCSIQERYEQVQVPSLNIAGWYDIFLDGTLRNFVGVRDHAATAAAREGSRLLIGPWTHTTPPLAQSGAVDFGLAAGQGASPLSMDVDGEHLRFFDRWLKGIDDGLDAEPPVHLFVMGEGVWRAEERWPLERATETAYFFHGDGGSATGGTLSRDEPSDDRPDVYLSDPVHPVPTVGGQLCCYPSQLPPGAFDQRAVAARPDVLFYATEPLNQDTEVTGSILVHLWAATSAPDADFTAKLVDIAADGSARNLTDGIVRGRYRLGTDEARPIVPDEPTEYTIDLWATSNLFRQGHHIGLEIASSNFPRFDRNPQTGANEQFGTEVDLRPARQTIFHDRQHPSRVILPIVPR